MNTTTENETAANREKIREAFEAWRDGTGSITDVFAPEMVWRIEGDSAASKQHQNTRRFVDATGVTAPV